MSKKNEKMERVDRQVRTIGAAAQRKISQSAVLVVGLGGVGVECAKNLILTGYRKIGVWDKKVVQMRDLGTNFFCKVKDVGERTRFEACVQDLQSMNEMCEIVLESSENGEISTDVLKKYDCVVFTEDCINDLIEINKKCREVNTKFIAVECRGVFGLLFVDFGDEFICVDTDGEKESQGTINNITVDDKGNVIIDTRDPDSAELPNLKVGDVIKLFNLENIPELNNSERKIVDRENAVTFNLGKINDKNINYVSGGRFAQIKQEKVIKFKSLEDCLSDYKKPGDQFLVYDYNKFDFPQKILFSFTKLWQFVRENKRFPKQHNKQDFERIVELIDKEEKIEYIDKNMLKLLSYTARGNTSPITTILGGLASQEVQKAVSGKYHPIKQWFCFECMDCLGEEKDEDEYQEIGSRYDSQIIIFGKSFQKLLTEQKYFLVGCGALGCEYLKGYAMTGLCCSEKGEFVITDLDEIETSNLSRQFLFRDKDVGRMKSECAAEKVKEMNEKINIKSMTDRVGSETEDIFNDAFWTKLDGIMNALDNLAARRYVDTKAVFYHKPLFESGTLGPKAHTQVIIPKRTINYSSQQDAQTHEFPECTIHVHPSTSQHTISWAKRLFTQTFCKSVEELGKFLKNREKYLDENSANLFSIETCHDYLVKNRPKNFNDCIDMGRRKFQEFFNYSIRNVLVQHPPDEKTESGAPFWSGNKRCPVVCKSFDAKNKTHYAFVDSYANLLAQFYGIDVPEEYDLEKICSNVIIEDYVPIQKTEEFKEEEINEEVMKKIEEKEKQEIQKQREYLSSLMEDLKQLKFEKKLTPLEFEKDDPLHIKFVTAGSNLRSECYKIPQITEYEVKGIAGNIIPAMVTTTAIATGFTLLEVFKYHQNKKIECMRNGFLNIGIPMVLLITPLSPPKTILGKYTVWDRLTIQKPKDISVGRFVEIIESKDGVKVESLSYGHCIILKPNLNPEMKKKILAAPIKKLTEGLIKEKIKKKILEYSVGVTKDGKSLKNYLPIFYSIKVNKNLSRLLKKKKLLEKKKREKK